MMKKNWKDIKGYEGRYQISNHGEIKSLERKIKNSGLFNTKEFLKKEKFLTFGTSKKDGYFIAYLYKESKRNCFCVHRLVAKHFIKNPMNKKEVNHKDCNKQNNNISNLEWVTSSENRIHAIKTLNIKFHGENSNSAVLNTKEVISIRKLYSTGDYTLKQLGKIFSVSYGTIWRIIKYETWCQI